MNVDFYIFGTPSGYKQYPAGGKSTLFQNFSPKGKGNAQLTISREGLLVYYIYHRFIPLGKNNSYIGFCLVFNNCYCKKTQELFNIFESAYQETALRGELLHFEDNGSMSFVVNEFGEKEIEIAYIKKFFLSEIDKLKDDFAPILPSFRVGYGSNILSIKQGNDYIETAIEQYDEVVITNGTKKASALEQIQKKYTQLYREKKELDGEYAKLLRQKKQYRAIFFLCLLLIACGIGLFIFNDNLKSRDSMIHGLTDDLWEKRETIDSLSQQNIYLTSEQEKLKNANSNMSEQLRKIKEQKEDLIRYSDSLYREYTLLEEEKERVERSYKEYSRPENCYTLYKVIAEEAYCYTKCGDNYNKQNCVYRYNQLVRVYIVTDGYGLTLGGYVKMSDLKR